MTYNVLMGTLNPTHSLTRSLAHSLTHSLTEYKCVYTCVSVGEGEVWDWFTGQEVTRQEIWQTCRGHKLEMVLCPVLYRVHFSLPVCLTVCLNLSLSLFLSLSICLSVCLSVRLSPRWVVSMSTILLLCESVFIWAPVCLKLSPG